MTEQTFTAVADWAERIQTMAQENSLINAQDIVHDVFGMLRDDEHFLPRLWITENTENTTRLSWGQLPAFMMQTEKR